jgi:hypothetical protein
MTCNASFFATSRVLRRQVRGALRCCGQRGVQPMLSGSCNCAHFDDVPRLLRRRLRGCRSQVQVPCITGDCRCRHAFSGAGAAACTWTMCDPHFFDTLAGWASCTDRVERPAALPHPVRWDLLHQQVRQTSSTPCSVGPRAPTGSRGLLLFHILFGWASRTNRFDRPLQHPVRLGLLHQQGCFGWHQGQTCGRPLAHPISLGGGKRC